MLPTARQRSSVVATSKSTVDNKCCQNNDDLSLLHLWMNVNESWEEKKNHPQEFSLCLALIPFKQICYDIHVVLKQSIARESGVEWLNLRVSKEARRWRLSSTIMDKPVLTRRAKEKRDFSLLLSAFDGLLSSPRR